MTRDRYHLFVLIGLLLVAWPGLSTVQAQTLLVDDVFDYAVGAVAAATNSGWEETAGTAGLIDVVAGSLTHGGYGSGTGNRLMLTGAEADSQIRHRFGLQSAGTVYVAMLFNAQDGLSGGESGFFFSMGRPPGAGVQRPLTLTFFGDGTDDTYRVCLSKSIVNSSCTGNLDAGTTYLIVVAYTFNTGSDEDDVAKLWIDPALDQPEPAPDRTEDSGTDKAGIDQITMEQEAPVPGLEIDDVRVATSWETLSASSANSAPAQPAFTSPSSDIIQTIIGDPNQPFVVEWSAVTDPDGDEVTYTWQLSEDDFATFFLDIDTGTSNRYETTLGALGTLLTDRGVELNQTVEFKHRVIASDGVATSESASLRLSFIRDALTSVETDDLPASFHLSEVYPNPFNPEARFTLEVARAQQVRLSVVDVLGREAALLYEGTLLPHQAHPFVFEAGALPSGLYLIRAVGEAFTTTRRVVLAK